MCERVCPTKDKNLSLLKILNVVLHREKAPAAAAVETASAVAAVNTAVAASETAAATVPAAAIPLAAAAATPASTSATTPAVAPPTAEILEAIFARRGLDALSKCLQTAKKHPERPAAESVVDHLVDIVADEAVGAAEKMIILKAVVVQRRGEKTKEMEEVIELKLSEYA